MKCRLRCDNPNPQFLDQMCNHWNVQEACNANLSSFYLSTNTNLSDAVYEQTCLSFPVKELVFNDAQIVPQPTCEEQSATNCTADCDSAAVMSFLQDIVIESQDVPYWATLQFQMLFGLMCGSWAAQAVVVSLSDSICFNLLGKTINK